MGAHINEAGLFQSDKYPTCPPGKVPLSVKDATAQDLLWEYAQRRRAVDAEFSGDLETALRAAGYAPPTSAPTPETDDDNALNGLPAHQGFVSAQERDWVLDGCRSEGKEGHYDRVWWWLANYRAGSSIPIPTHRMIRNSWDLDAVMTSAKEGV